MSLRKLPTVAGIAAWPIVVVLAIVALTRNITLGSSQMDALARGTVFGLVSVLPTVGSVTLRWNRNQVVKVVLGSLIALCLYWCLALVAVRQLGRAVSAAGLTLLASAVIEEIVFRRRIPTYVEGVMGHGSGMPSWVATTVAVCVSQVSFALCHINPLSGGRWDANPSRLVVLFLVGLFYWQLVSIGGVAVGASFHAAVNLYLASYPIFLTDRIGPVELTLWSVIAVALVVTSPTASCTTSRIHEVGGGGSGHLSPGWMEPPDREA